MATLERQKRQSISIYNYPEHLNPFSEDDNVGKLHFWNVTKKKSRSSSFSLTGLKDLRNTWSFKSLTKKGRRELQAKAEKNSISSAANSPIVYRKQYDETASSLHASNNRGTLPSQGNRYIYGGSVTPLPRFRFHERGTISNPQQLENQLSPTAPSRRTSAPGRDITDRHPPSLNELKVESHGSQTSLLSNGMGGVRASTRKKRRAPPPPQIMGSAPPHIVVTDTSAHESKSSLIESSLREIPPGDDIDIDHPSLNTELKIIEDIDENPKNTSETVSDDKPAISEVSFVETDEKKNLDISEEQNKNVTVEVDNSNTERIEIKENIEESTIKLDVSIKESNADESTSIVYDSADEILLESPEKAKDTLADVNFVIQKITIKDDLPDDLFQKVDIVSYKKQQSIEPNEVAEEVSSFKVDSENNRITSPDGNNLSNDNLINNNNLVENKGKDAIWNGVNSDIQIVKCKVVDCQDSTKYTLRSKARSEFFEIDKATEDIGREAAAVREGSNNNLNYQRRTVSDMKLLFDNPKTDDSKLKLNLSPGFNSPNPIPKPRRTRLGSKTSSSSESFKAESPCSDVEEKLSL